MTDQKPDTTYTLLDAVDDLTLDQRRKERQEVIRHGHVIGHQRVDITLPPLLTQLAEAIRGTIGAGSSGSLSSERNLLDADALFKFIQIDAQIRDWCRGLKILPSKDPADNLRAWYVARLTHTHEAEDDSYHIKKLGQWAGQIRSKLDPWRERELPDECPACGAKSWWRDGAEYFRPLIIKYKPTGPDLIQEARCLCRACEQTWGVRELAYELELRHAAENATEATVQA
jgi:hypothetical protein